MRGTTSVEMERLVVAAWSLCHGLSLIHVDLEGPGRICKWEAPRVEECVDGCVAKWFQAVQVQ